MSAPTPISDPDAPIPFSRPEITADDIAAVVRVLESGWVTTGKESAAFEAEMAAYLGVNHVVTVSSCTTATEICLAYLDLPAGSRVAVPTWTFVSTALAVERVGCVPVLVDVDRDTLNIDEDGLQAALEAGASAVVGVHFSGTPMSADVHAICADAGAPLVEDAAHAFGSKDERGFVAGQGTAGACYSFYATKNLTTAEGGAVATDDPGLAAYSRQYRLHGMSADAVDRYSRPGAHSYDVTMPGLKANMPDVLATLGRSQLARMSESQKFRHELVGRYRECLADTDIRFIPGEPHPGSAVHLMAVDMGSADRRDAVILALTAANIGSSVHFRPLHTFSWYDGQNAEIGPKGVPVASELDGSIMSLPLHLNLSFSDVERVCETVRSAI